MPAGRPAQPVELHLLKGNIRHLTKAEIEERKKAQVQLGEHRLVCPAYVKANKAAHRKWKEIAKLYKDIDFVSSADVGMMARYCVAFAEYLDLVGHRAKVAAIEIDVDDAADAVEALAVKYGTRRAERLFAKVEYLLSVNGLLAIDKAINAKMQTLVQMEDRLFLNPLAKVRNIPKREEPQKDPLADKGFGGV